MPRTVPGMCSVLRTNERIIITAWSLYSNSLDGWKNEWCFLVFSGILPAASVNKGCQSSGTAVTAAGEPEGAQAGKNTRL